MLDDTIDQLRHLVGHHDIRNVSITMLKGLIEIPDVGAMQIRYAERDDVAYVVTGPKDKIQATRVETDGKITYTITFEWDKDAPTTAV